MKRWLIGAAALVLITLMIVASVRSGGPKGEKVYVEPAATRKVEAVVNAQGEIDPRVKVNISAHIVGKIEKLYFKEGDAVRRGQKLVDLERPNFIAQRDRAAAEVRNRRIEVARSQLALANADLSYKRALSMKQQGISAQELFDRVQLELSNARAGVASAEEGVRQAEASLTQANEDLSRTTIVSPIDGKAVKLNAHEGEVVVTGTMNNAGSVIAIIADLSEILVNAEVGETEVVGIRVGQPVTIKVDAMPNKEYRGHVVEIGSSAEIKQQGGSGIRYFDVKAAIDTPDEALRPGMTSQVSIVTQSVPHTIALPIQAVVDRVPGSKRDDDEDDDAPKKKYLFLAQNGKAKQVEVTTGISDATHVAVLSGVKAGDPVITGPYRTMKKLHDGDAIHITKESKSGSAAEKKKSDKNDEKDDE